ncbi:MAG: hypothetical protein E6F98_15205 [Actinobacteria bacterium]|nr:MAG: hypothetical protein E6F98_15205 [Actinomycetota bacterium]
MSLFKREEPLHERLAREGGLVERQPRAPWREVGIHGMQRLREWDVTVTADAPGIEGDTATFVALPDGSLADAVEQELQPPYRARAARQRDDLWAVQARRIEVVHIRNGPEGDSLELTREGLLVDDVRAFGSVPELEGRGDVVHAERLDGDLWEVRASSL